MAASIQIEGDETQAELIVALILLGEHAHRQQCIVGTLAHPSCWDTAHAAINVLLDDIVGQ